MPLFPATKFIWGCLIKIIELQLLSPTYAAMIHWKSVSQPLPECERRRLQWDL